jgi:hydroxyacylglutathione hydrolase
LPILPRPTSHPHIAFEIKRFVLGPLETNGYLVWEPVSREALVIDPGDDPSPLLAWLAKQDLRLVAIFNTHGHADHIGGNGALKQAFGAPLVIHAADAAMLNSPPRNLSAALGGSVTSPGPDRLVGEGDILQIGHTTFRVLETPGHTPGSICLLGPGALFSGDTLFAGSVGRTDLPGGNGEQLQQSLAKLMATLEDDTRIFPGHGPETLAGIERQNNPFLRRD